MLWKEWQPIAAFLSSGIGKEWDATQARVWFGILEDLPAEAVKAAVTLYLAEAQFPGFPPPGAIRLRAVTLLATGGGPQSAVEGWELARKSAADYCEYDAERSRKAVEALDSVTAQTVRSLGGLRAIAHSTNVSVIRGQFMRAWDQNVRTRTTAPLLPAPAEVKRIKADHKRITADPAAVQLAGRIGNRAG